MCLQWKRSCLLHPAARLAEGEGQCLGSAVRWWSCSLCGLGTSEVRPITYGRLSEKELLKISGVVKPGEPRFVGVNRLGIPICQLKIMPLHFGHGVLAGRRNTQACPQGRSKIPQAETACDRVIVTQDSHDVWSFLVPSIGI